MLQSIRKIVLKSVVVTAAAAIMATIPALNSTATEAETKVFTANQGGVSAFLSVIGNSYDIKPVDSEIMGLVVSQAQELEIDFDTSLYEEEYANFAIANVSDFINVRSESNTDSQVVGHMYNGSVCEILDRTECEDGVWFKVVSGNVEGYVRSDFFIHGDEALEVIEDYVKKVAVVRANVLNVREEPNTDANVIGSVKSGDKLDVAEDEDIRAERMSRAKDASEVDGEDEEVIEEEESPQNETITVRAPQSNPPAPGEDAEETDEASEEEEKPLEWVKVNYTNDHVGYVCLDYVTIQESYVTAKTIEEERAEAEAKRKAEEQRRQAAAAAAAAALAQQQLLEDTTISGGTSYSSSGDLRSSIIEYALQFVGTRYVMGGQSLSGGTDCSGFTCYVLSTFGISVGRTPSSQLNSAGRSISLDQAQPGDIICYGSGGCSHVALYIGDGQIVHEANSRMGCCVSGINFMNIVGVKNVID